MEDAERIRELARQVEIQQMRLNVISIALQTLLSTLDDEVAGYFCTTMRGRVAKLMQDHAHFVGAEVDAATAAELNVLLRFATRDGPA